MENVYNYECLITNNGIKRTDGVIFLKSSFEQNDKSLVPLIWNGIIDDPSMVLGSAILENRNEGVYAKLTFNNRDNGIIAKQLLLDGDAEVSFMAHKIKRDGPVIESGYISCVCLIPSGCGFYYGPKGS